METRLPAHVEVAGLVRAVSANGGFATVLATGDRDAGTILAICCNKGTDAVAWERMPDTSGGRRWTPTKRQDSENPQEFQGWIERRRGQDPDLWLIELDIPQAERFILSEESGG